MGGDEWDGHRMSDREVRVVVCVCRRTCIVSGYKKDDHDETDGNKSGQYRVVGEGGVYE